MESFDHIHWENKGVVGICTLPIDEIDERLIEEDPTHSDSLRVQEEMERDKFRSDPAAILLASLEAVVPGENLTRAGLQAIGVRVVALLWLIGSGKYGLNAMTLSAVAEKLGVTRALMSHWVRVLEEKFDIHNPRQKRKGAINVYRDASSKGWKTRRRIYGAKGGRKVQPFKKPKMKKTSVLDPAVIVSVCPEIGFEEIAHDLSDIEEIGGS